MTTDVVPILRVADAAAAVVWYRRLGFEQQFEHRFEPHLPAYVGIRRGGAQIHLSEHTGDATPGTLVYLWVDEIDPIAAEFGVQWQIDPRWTVRAGYNRSENPIRPEDVTFNILAPGVMEDHYTAGLTYSMGKDGDISAFYMYAPEVSGKSQQQLTASAALRQATGRIHLDCQPIDPGWQPRDVHPLAGKIAVIHIRPSALDSLIGTIIPRGNRASVRPADRVEQAEPGLEPESHRLARAVHELVVGEVREVIMPVTEGVDEVGVLRGVAQRNVGVADVPRLGVEREIPTRTRQGAAFHHFTIRHGVVPNDGPWIQRIRPDDEVRCGGIGRQCSATQQQQHPPP